MTYHSVLKNNSEEISLSTIFVFIELQVELTRAAYIHITCVEVNLL
jgi:hypothetical protein